MVLQQPEPLPTATVVPLTEDTIQVSGLTAEFVTEILREAGVDVTLRVAALPTEVDLSAREVAILRLIGSGRTNDQIAADLYLSINTVKSYIRSAYRKMGVSSRSQAVRWAIHHRLAIPGADGHTPAASTFWG